MSAYPTEFAYLEQLSHADLEKELIPFAQKAPEDMTDEEISKACTIHRLLAKTTSGPARVKSAADQFAAQSLEDMLGGLLGKTVTMKGT